MKSPIFRAVAFVTVAALALTLTAQDASADASNADSDVAVSADAQGVDFEPIPTWGIVSTLGPQVGISGPPSALAIKAGFWHRLVDRIAFHASVGMAFGGETTFEGSGDTPDATYSSTVGAEFASGIRYLLDLGDIPVDTWVRGDLAVDLTGGQELIGYMLGPAAAFGVGYRVADGLDLVAEAEIGLGYGQYRAESAVFAATFDLLVGAQIGF